MPDHDGLYHRLFNDPRVVAELLREFVPGPWLADLDLTAMERQNARFHAVTGDKREGDMIWRIPRRDGGDSYLMLLLEFQSTSDRSMPLRMMVYAGLLWQQLVNEKSLPPDSKLPPIMPVVLYNGNRPWSAPLALDELVGLPDGSPLWHWQPEMRYQVVDVAAFSEDDLARRDGLLALLFRLEASPSPEQAVVLADAVLAWFRLHPGFDSARSEFATLLGALLAPLVPGVQVPEELLEVRNMLATRVDVWKRQLLQEGRQEGLQEGRQAGEVALLLRQLERRFGTLPGWARERVAAAETPTLEEWGLRLLDAASLDDVLT